MKKYPLAFNKRNGFSASAKKRHKEPLRIAYIGGSNTVLKEGWRPRMHQWLNEAFPTTQPHTEINLSIGAIGSLAASFILPQNLAGTRPDVAFVEYTLNDYNWMSWEGGYFGNELQSPATTSSSIEGIVRMILRENPACDIFFIHMPTIEQMKGESPLASNAMCEYEPVAEYYGIPSLFIAQGFRDLEEAGALQPGDYENLFRDTAHLSQKGLELMMEMFQPALNELFSEAGAERAVPAPMNAITTVDACPVPVEPWMIEGPFTQERFKNSRFDLPYLSLAPGSRLNVEYSGVPVGINSAFGPDTPGTYRASVNERQVTLNLHTSSCVKPHLGSIILNKDLSRTVERARLTCEALPELPDYSRFPNCSSVMPRNAEFPTVATRFEGYDRSPASRAENVRRSIAEPY